MNYVILVTEISLRLFILYKMVTKGKHNVSFIIYNTKVFFFIVRL